MQVEKQPQPAPATTASKKNPALKAASPPPTKANQKGPANAKGKRGKWATQNAFRPFLVIRHLIGWDSCLSV